MKCVGPDWSSEGRVTAFTTVRHAFVGGCSLPPFDSCNFGNAQGPAGDDPERVAMNRQALQAAAALPGAPHWLRQVHGSEVVRFEGGPAGADQDRTEADAAVTDQPGTVLAILTADCLPVLFSAVDGSEIAAAHAGWRGLCDGVLEATVCAMHTPAHRLQAWLGPAAGPLAYEVGAEVRQAFIARSFDAATAFAPTRPGHFLCDLYTLARQRLEAIGLEAVSGGGYCTISDEARFFSHRRDQRSGRMASLIWIRPSA